ncbi:MAG: heavy metal-binding domain-containing protein [Solirubrobacteraceae bacterium]
MSTEEEEQEQSLARIERGGITVAAERRLSELRDKGGLFTSDLTVNGWALAHQLGLRPLSQVMGSSIYQMGYQSSWGQLEGGYDPTGSNMFELGTLSQALNEVRTRALGRLAEEAMHVGADAVVEVDTRAGESSLETGMVSLEHTVFGTAVSRNGSLGSSRHTGGRPVLTELSVADFSKLVRGGFEPLGIVAWSAVFFASYGYGSGLGGGMMGGGMLMGGMQNFELSAFTQAFYNARESVMAELNAQATAMGASGIVGVRIGHRAVRHEMQGMNGKLSGLMVTFNAIGTAIRQTGEATLYAPETTIDLTT